MCLSYCSLEYYQSSMRIQEKSPPYYVIFCRIFLSTPSLSSTPILLRKESLAPENEGGGGGGGGGGAGALPPPPPPSVYGPIHSHSFRVGVSNTHIN